jgi:hypothetical protein
MKKTFLLFFVISLLSLNANSQILKPISWSYAAKKTSASEATIYIKAKLDKGWHLYSQYVREGGPAKTTFAFIESKGFNLVGKTIEPKPITQLEPVFLMEVGFFETFAVFHQKIKLKEKNVVVKGSVEYMVCNDKQCLPPQKVEFSIPIK